MFKRLYQFTKDHCRRRRWRYVSTGRHGAGLLLLMLLVVMVYGYWYMTNDRRIRHYAESFLSELAGGRAKVEHAHMGIFGKISLRNVRVYLPGSESPKPFFRAKIINLRHQPWNLLLKGRLDPTEVICQDSVLTMEYDAETGRNLTYGYLSQMGTGGGMQPARWEELMAAVRIRQLHLRKVVVGEGMRQLVDENILDVSMTPSGPDKYTIAYEGQRKVGESFIHGSAELNVGTGEIVHSGSLRIEGLRRTLPPKHHRWLRRFGVKGKILYKGRTSLAGDQVVFETELDGVSLELPKEQGGLDLADVRGTLLFAEDGVTLKNITGRIEQSGRAEFNISGQYGGYRQHSPYRVKISIRGMNIPDVSKLTDEDEKPAPLAAVLGEIRRRFRPEGPVDISVLCSRPENGKTTFKGTAEPRGVKMLYNKFKYPLHDVSGTIDFDSRRVVVKKVTGRGNGADVTITGVVRPHDKQYDISIRAEKLPLDDTLRSAMPEELLKLWDSVSPGGRAAAATARIYRKKGDEKRHTEIGVSLKGRAEITYTGFPYPLGGLVGEVAFDDDSMEISRARPLMASTGQMRCQIYGRIRGLRSKSPLPEMTVEAFRVPIDDKLLAAVGERTRKTISQFSPAGRIRKVVAEVGRKADGRLDYDVSVMLDGASFRYAEFPYPVEDVSGRLSILPDRAIIEEITGAHKEAKIGISGQVFLRKKNPGVDLHIEAENIDLGRELRAALPDSLKEVWRRFDPAGAADLSIDISRNVPTPGLDYRAAIRPRDMSVTWRGLPYTVEGITGTIITTPDKTTLKNLSARSGKMRASLNGTINTAGKRTVADLNLSAENLPFRPMLVKALPGDVSKLAKNFHKGGTVSFNLPRLRVVTEDITDSSASTAPATVPARRPRRRIANWNMEGDVSVKDVKVDLGLGARKITGGISGRMGRGNKGLSIETDMELSGITWGRQSIENLRARLLKAAGSNLLRVEDISGGAYGGRLAGFAEIKLKDKLQYGLSVSVEEVKLDKLYSAVGGEDEKRPEKESQVKGLLAGNIQLVGVAGKPESRQAFGVLRISKGSIYRLPVLLGLLRVVYLSLPSDSAFTRGNLTYQMTGHKLVFREIYLTGPAISIVGSGRMNTKTGELDLNFLTGPPGKLPPIAGLDQIIQSLAREIMEIHITGTLQKPRTRAQSLRSLDEAIRRLVNPEQEKETSLPHNE